MGHRRSFVYHVPIHWPWKTCPHGRVCELNPFLSRQIEHSGAWTWHVFRFPTQWRRHWRDAVVVAKHLLLITFHMNHHFMGGKFRRFTSSWYSLIKSQCSCMVFGLGVPPLVISSFVILPSARSLIFTSVSIRLCIMHMSPPANGGYLQPFTLQSMYR